MKTRYSRWFPLLILFLGILAYANSLSGQFVFDDKMVIENNPYIRQLFFCKPTTRCFVDLTYAINYATGKLNPADYHATSLFIHLMAGLVLYGIVRRTLLLPQMAQRFRDDASLLAFFMSATWLVHPLTTSAVTYLSQRYESLMGMFYLLTLYCVIRGSIQKSVVSGSRSLGVRPLNFLPPSLRYGATRRKLQGQTPSRSEVRSQWWYGLAVTACALGMASKEVMITAPVTVWLYDRIFLARSAGDVIRKRWPVYIGFLFCWVLLALLMVFGTSPEELMAIPIGKEGLGSGETRLSVIAAYYAKCDLYYFATQYGVILHYLRLAFWPNPLCLDYSWPIVNELTDALPSFAVLVLVGALVLIAFKKRPALGFAGAFFFIALAPTSSFFPRPDCAFEYRMYLALAAPVACFVIAWYDVAYRLSSRSVMSVRARWLLTSVPLCVILAVFSSMTYLRNRDYYSEEAMWHSVLKVSPNNARAQCGLITGLLANSAFTEAETVSRQLLDRVNAINQSIGTSRRYVPTNSVMHFYFQANNFLGQALLCQGRREEALDYLNEAIKVKPDSEFAHNCKGVALSQLGRNKEAIEEWLIAVAVNPGYGRAHANLARAFERLSSFQEAVYHYQKAIDSGPGFIPEKFNLAWLLATCPDEDIRDGRKAVELAVSVCETTGYDSAHVLDLLAAAYAEAGRFEDAVATAEKAVSLTADHEVKQRLDLYRQGKPYQNRMKK